MPQSIDKKNRIIIYLTFLLILSTVSSKTLDNDKIYSIKINVTGLSNSKNLQLVNKLNDLFYKNIFFINKDEIKKIISVNNIIEEYNVRKIYPSKLDIDIKLTKFIAKISANKKLIVGSNGKLIKSETIHDSLPYIFGEFNSKKFLEFKKHIDHSEFNFKDLR
jgi:cell division protein FtsQ